MNPPGLPPNNNNSLDFLVTFFSRHILLNNDHLLVVTIHELRSSVGALYVALSHPILTQTYAIHY